MFELTFLEVAVYFGYLVACGLGVSALFPKTAWKRWTLFGLAVFTVVCALALFGLSKIQKAQNRVVEEELTLMSKNITTQYNKLTSDTDKSELNRMIAKYNEKCCAIIAEQKAMGICTWYVYINMSKFALYKFA